MPSIQKNQRRVRIGDREVVTHGLAKRVFQDLYHYCMTTSWGRLLLSWAGVFVLFNAVFSLLYYWVPGCIANLNPPGYFGNFFFSMETLATVGYGDMHPATLYGHIVAGAEIFMGISSLALVTGVTFARFSRPNARFLFADVGVIRQLDGRTVLMFRAANARQNVIMDAAAKLHLMKDVTTPEGYEIRRIVDLKLEREDHPFFILGWNMYHVIDETSPLANETVESLRAADARFHLSLRGTDETTGQVLMARKNYSPDVIRWNHSYVDIISTDADGMDHFDYRRFHETEPYDSNSLVRKV